LHQLLVVDEPSIDRYGPDKMNVNGHFASIGQNGEADFEHGIQVIDEDKEFKYATNDSLLGQKPRQVHL